MIPLFPVAPASAPAGEPPAPADNVARCDYLEAVKTAQYRCEAEITAARTAYIQAEHAAWVTYQAADDGAVRAWYTETESAVSRWFTPAAGSRPYTDKET